MNFKNMPELEAIEYARVAAPGRELSGDGGLLGLAGHGAGFKRKGQHFAQRVDLLQDAANVVGDISGRWGPGCVPGAI
jgi:hypothetical protein